MPDHIQFNIPLIDNALDQYYDDLDALALLVLNGTINESDFMEEMTRLVLAMLLLAFATAGGNQTLPGADTLFEQARAQSLSSIALLADDIFSGRYSARTAAQASEGRPEQTAAEGRGKLQNRLVLWVNGAGAMYNEGLIYQDAALNPETGLVEVILYMWVIGATEEHCADCLLFNGMILTAEEWRSLPRPQSPDLECGGWHCDCRYVRIFVGESVGLENLGI